MPLPSQLSNYSSLQQQQQQQQQQVSSLLLTKTLQHLNNNSSFIFFKNKILKNKNKPILFYQNQLTQQIQKNNHRASNLIIKINSGKKLAHDNKNIKKDYQHSIYDNNTIQYTQKSLNNYSKIFKSGKKNKSKDKRRFKTLNNLDQNQSINSDYYNNSQYQKKQDYSRRHKRCLSKPISKIEQLVQKQKQQTIDQLKYNNQNYLFMKNITTNNNNDLNKYKQNININKYNNNNNSISKKSQSNNLNLTKDDFTSQLNQIRKVNFNIKLKTNKLKTIIPINQQSNRLQSRNNNLGNIINNMNSIQNHNQHNYQQEQQQIRLKAKSLTKYDRQNNNNIKNKQKNIQFFYSNQKNNDMMNQTGQGNNNIMQKLNFGQLLLSNNNNNKKQQNETNQTIKLIPNKTSINNTNNNKNEANQRQPLPLPQPLQNHNQVTAGLKSFLNSIALGLNKSNSSPEPMHIATSQQDNQLFLKQLNSIKSYYQQSNQEQQYLFKILSGISKQPNVDAIRIYKDDFSKIYSYRYGRDKITSFFDYQYIQDHDSLNGMFQQFILNFTKQQVLVISFIMLDFDNDGLISHSDLFKLLLRSNQNQLIKRNIFKILQFNKTKVLPIRDKCNEDYLKRDNLTLKKFKFMIYMNQKKNNAQPNAKGSSGKDGNINSNKSNRNNNNNNNSNSNNDNNNNNNNNSTSRNTKKAFQLPPDTKNSIPPLIRKHFSLFSSQIQLSKQNQILKILLQAISKNNQSQLLGLNSFSINLSTFKQIFSSSIPQIYYDMLYSAFGYKHKNYPYFDLDYQTPLLKPIKIQQIQQLSKWDILIDNLNGMKQMKQDMKEKLMKYDGKRQSKIKMVINM